MGFEYQKAPHEKYGRWTYSDELIDHIYHVKTDLKIDVEKELDELKKLKEETELEYNNACSVRDRIVDWDSDEAIEADDLCSELNDKINSLEDWIDALEDLNEKL